MAAKMIYRIVSSEIFHNIHLPKNQECCTMNLFYITSKRWVSSTQYNIHFVHSIYILHVLTLINLKTDQNILHLCAISEHISSVCNIRTYCICVQYQNILHMCAISEHIASVCNIRTYCICVQYHNTLHLCAISEHIASVCNIRTYCNSFCSISVSSSTFIPIRIRVSSTKHDTVESVISLLIPCRYV